MIKAIEFPDQTFADKADLFASLLKNESRLISLKKAAIFNSKDKGQGTCVEMQKVDEAIKAALGLKDGYVYAVINTTRYMDSHDDVHFDGIWNKSLRDQAGKLFYVADHSLSIDDVIVWPEDLKAVVKNVPWSFVNKSYEGDTQALIYVFKESAIDHDKAKKAIEKKRPVQNSVRMRYVTIKMAINDPAEDYKKQKAYFDARIGEIANREYAEEKGYFFGIEEAEISKEGSMVLFGSNDATATIYQQAADSTDGKNEPPTSTRQSTKLFNPNLI